MEFALTDEQTAMVDTARQFAGDRLAPGYAAREKTGEVEPEVWREMGQLGLIATELPEDVGGIGCDTVTAGLLQEAMSTGDINVALLALLALLNGQIVYHNALPEVAAHWLPPLIGGEIMLALALTEPGSGSDAAQLRLQAVRDGADFILNGEKTSISAADQAHAAVVFARTDPDAGARGISAFLVDLNSPGVSRTRFNDVGMRAVGRGSLFFDDVRVPATHLLGRENQGFGQVMSGFDYSRALIGLHCIGVARVALDETWAYANERHTFGVPIGNHQGVSFPLVESQTLLEGARLLCLKTLWLKDRGLPHTSEAAMCKWWGPKLATDILRTCLLTHGHGGYADGLPFEQRLRDVMGYEIGDGTAQIMKLIIARGKLGRRV